MILEKGKSFGLSLFFCWLTVTIPSREAVYNRIK